MSDLLTYDQALNPVGTAGSILVPETSSATEGGAGIDGSSAFSEGGAGIDGSSAFDGGAADGASGQTLPKVVNDDGSGNDLANLQTARTWGIADEIVVLGDAANRMGNDGYKARVRAFIDRVFSTTYSSSDARALQADIDALDNEMAGQLGGLHPLARQYTGPLITDDFTRNWANGLVTGQGYGDQLGKVLDVAKSGVVSAISNTITKVLLVVALAAVIFLVWAGHRG